MATHELKTDPEVFQAQCAGYKRFELRLDDRGFSVGDTLLLKETKFSCDEMKAGQPLIYTGRTSYMSVAYILRGPCYGLEAGWVIMS